jgi:hypothetical protein
MPRKSKPKSRPDAFPAFEAALQRWGNMFSVPAAIAAANFFGRLKTRIDFRTPITDAAAGEMLTAAMDYAEKIKHPQMP